MVGGIITIIPKRTFSAVIMGTAMIQSVRSEALFIISE